MEVPLQNFPWNSEHIATTTTKTKLKKKSFCLKKKNEYGQSSYSLTGSVTNS